uniref:Putative secreted protein n=1 Tax=Ixodes ricinus TaxID=34613 RepID=A0A6B0U8D2_IXORI
MTHVQPAASAAPIFLVIMALGKFQGVMMAATPIGCLMKSISFPLTGAGTWSPYVLRASAENHSRNEAPYATSPRDSTKGLPFSAVMSLASSSVCCSCRL